jgi:hypothetical protein
MIDFQLEVTKKLLQINTIKYNLQILLLGHLDGMLPFIVTTEKFYHIRKP